MRRRIAAFLRAQAERLDPQPVFSFNTKAGEGFSQATFTLNENRNRP